MCWGKGRSVSPKGPTVGWTDCHTPSVSVGGADSTNTSEASAAPSLSPDGVRLTGKPGDPHDTAAHAVVGEGRY